LIVLQNQSDPKNPKIRRRVLGMRIPSMHAECIHTSSGHPPPISHSSVSSI
jgi:hypothetical protein